MNTIADYLYYCRNIEVTASEAAALEKHWTGLGHAKAQAVSAANPEEPTVVLFDATRGYNID